MVLFAFVLFGLLIAGWLAAPAGSEEKAPKSASAPILTVSEATA